MGAPCPGLDHIAFAVHHVEGHRDPVEVGLGGRSLGIDGGSEFHSEQWVLSNGMRLELLEPRGDGRGFLQRFLDRSGPGAHHLTFRVEDVHSAVAELESAGFEVHSVRTDRPDWHEAFLHPKTAFGTVVQIAAYPDTPGSRSAASLDPRAAALDTIELAVDDRERAYDLFCRILGGLRETDTIGWPQRAQIRLVGAEPDGVRAIEVSVPGRHGPAAAAIESGVFGGTAARLCANDGR